MILRSKKKIKREIKRRQSIVFPLEFDFTYAQLQAFYFRAIFPLRNSDWKPDLDSPRD